MAAEDLVVLAEVKQALDITTTEDDELLTRLITAVSVLCNQQTSRTLKSATYTAAKLNGSGSQVQMMRNTPLTAISVLTIDGVVIPASSGWGVNGYFFDQDAIYLRNYRFTKGIGNVAVSYTAGYTVVPDDLKQAAIEMIGVRYRMRNKVEKQSESLGGGSVSYSQEETPPTVKHVLNYYARMHPC